MFMILAHHFAVHNSYDYTWMAAGPLRLFIQVFLESGGKVGVVIFFTISAWFFLEHGQTVRGCCLRVWRLEKEVLFYSLLLSILCFTLGLAGIKTLIRGFFPLVFSVWWYATAYALFLLFLPFLELGLRGMGERNHLLLALLMLFIYGLISLIPKTQMVDGVYSFVYLFVLISAYRWYLEDHVKMRPWILIAAGMAIILVYVLSLMTLQQLFGIRMGSPSGDFLTRYVRLPVVLVGFGLFLLFERVSFCNRAINSVAKGAFAVYLITDFSVMQQRLWSGPLDLQVLCGEPFGFFIALGALVFIYVVCTLIDLLRQGIFRLTIDKYWDDLFEKIWTKGNQFVSRLVEKIALQ